MNERNKEINKLIEPLDECGYEIIEIKPVYTHFIENLGERGFSHDFSIKIRKTKD